MKQSITIELDYEQFVRHLDQYKIPFMNFAMRYFALSVAESEPLYPQVVDLFWQRLSEGHSKYLYNIHRNVEWVGKDVCINFLRKR